MTYFIQVIRLLINNESLLMTNNLTLGNLSKLLRFHLHIVLLAHFGQGKIFAENYNFLLKIDFLESTQTHYT